MAQFMLLPVITRGLPLRVGYVVLVAILYDVCLRTFWFDWLWWRPVINGGALAGVLSHPIPMLLGSVLHDWCLWTQGRLQTLESLAAADVAAVGVASAAVEKATRLHRRLFARTLVFHVGALLSYATLLMVTGMLLSLPPQDSSPGCIHDSRQPVSCADGPVLSLPFIQPTPDTISMWSMSLRTASVSFQFFGSGYAVGIFAFAWLLSDVAKVQVPFLTLLSEHSLIMYILRDLGFAFVEKIVPSDSPLFMMVPALVISLLINVNVVYYLKRHSINLRL